MDQLVFKMDEPPELEEIDETSMFKMEPDTGFKMDPSDLDVDFSPQTRTRCNTWPLPRPDNYVDEPSPPNNVKHEDYETLGELGALLSEAKCNGVHTGLPSSGGLAQLKKTATSRRNAWGSSSYADLISQAITSSPEQRLTLSQIYDWMIQNVPYFKDKGDSNSRHNLSLHNRFMRVQNEGTGKSSWWMINPDAKPGKSSVSESLDIFPEDSPIHFQLSPDYRQRASSNASSCGRLSPIPSQEREWLPYTHPYLGAEQLAGSLEQTMKLGDPAYMSYPSPPPYHATSPRGSYGAQPPPPPYQSPSNQQQQCPHHLVNSCSCCQQGIKQESISPSYLASPSPSPPATLVGQVLSTLNGNNAIDDFLSIDSLQGNFECNVDEVIRHEISLEGDLDFNFPPSNSSPMMTSSASSQPYTTNEPQVFTSNAGQSWVH
uniref:Forkhead box protein O n=1 Tax=Cacopsylla chinensis TaxID=471117 RepID=A0AAU7YTS5_9HEMI